MIESAYCDWLATKIRCWTCNKNWINERKATINRHIRKSSVQESNIKLSSKQGLCFFFILSTQNNQLAHQDIMQCMRVSPFKSVGNNCTLLRMLRDEFTEFSKIPRAWPAKKFLKSRLRLKQRMVLSWRHYWQWQTDLNVPVVPLSVLSVHTHASENTYHVQWARGCRCKQEADRLLCSRLLSYRKLHEREKDNGGD